VLKADGPAAGKGVLTGLKTGKKPKQALRQMIEGKQFGASSEKVVIEQFPWMVLSFSVFVITDGHSYQLLP
jgi:phosphoribosylamine--glycine ligase